MKARVCFGLFLLLAFSSTCLGGWLENTLENAGKSLGNRAVNDAGNSAYDATKRGVKEGVKGIPTDDKSSSQNKSSSSRSSRQESEGTVSVSSLSIEEAETVFSKFDFIPGDKTIFFDDFADTDVGEFPRKWHLSGPKGSNNVSIEVVEYQGRHFMRTNPATKGQRQFESTQYLRLNQKGDLPEKFTIEFDACLSHAFASNTKFPNTYFLLLLNNDKVWPGVIGKQSGKLRLSGLESSSLNTGTSLNLQDEKVHHISVSVNGSFVKAYIDNVRVINDPDAFKRPIRLVGLTMANVATKPTDKLMITNFRLAEGGKDIRTALETDGRIITHGIQFDTGRDSLKPESLPTLRKILSLLNDDPDLRFSIEGHTDSQGNRGINQPLSERRAAAVKEWLVWKGIDPSRLSVEGYGDSKPIDSNKTPEGRANNRRVEFVKL
ncbi:MAG: OmpA family protein [Desulfuromonadales bacterium]|nr:OmpA family protein [Desulfuromonadales bacterium]